MQVKHPVTESYLVTERSLLWRSPLLMTALLAVVGAVGIYAFALPALWRMSWPYGLLFTALGLTQLGTAVAVLAYPGRRRVVFAAAAALAVLALWLLARIARVLPQPDPWVPVNSVIGFTDDVCAGLELTAALGLVTVAASRSQARRSLPRRVLAAMGIALLVAIVLLGSSVGVFASSDAFAGAGFPSGIVSAVTLPAGQMSTVEYCRPDGVPLAMDVYMPFTAANTVRPAPIVLYVHGGGIWGDRKMYGLGATQANHQGALFTPLQQRLNANGFVVASIDYRLPPGTPWPAQIQDAKCAVRFLRAHAADLGIDPGRIGVWGSSGGGTLVSLLGLAGPDAGFDLGQYSDQSSAVQAVVDMFGVADLNDVDDASGFGQFILQATFGSSTSIRRSASPISYVASSAPPFLILQGTQDPLVHPRQSARFAERLQTAGVPITLVEVQGAGHSLTTPGQQPSPEELAARISDFFVKILN